MSFPNENLREIFDIPLETYLSPQNRFAAYQLWQTVLQSQINNFTVEQFNKKFEEFFKKYAKKYFAELKDQMVDLIEKEFIKLKKELKDDLHK